MKKKGNKKMALKVLVIILAVIIVFGIASTIANKQNIKKMTEKQFQEAVAINKRIVALEESLHKICSNDNSILYYIYKNCNRDYSLHPSWVINPLSSLLAKHDAMIREEIKQEIEALKKKIEAL